MMTAKKIAKYRAWYRDFMHCVATQSGFAALKSNDVARLVEALGVNEDHAGYRDGLVNQYAALSAAQLRDRQQRCLANAALKGWRREICLALLAELLTDAEEAEAHAAGRVAAQAPGYEHREVLPLRWRIMAGEWVAA